MCYIFSEQQALRDIFDTIDGLWVIKHINYCVGKWKMPNKISGFLSKYTFP